MAGLVPSGASARLKLVTQIPGNQGTAMAPIQEPGAKRSAAPAAPPMRRRRS